MAKIVIASGNRGKIKEFEELLNIKITPYYELLGDIEIVEDKDTFAGNALIKAREIYNKLGSNYIVISDDSGISIDKLNNEPGVFSARYAKVGATDKENLQKAISELKNRGENSSKAHYTAAIAIVSKYGEFVVHGWMHGEVTINPKGEKGFGYDPMFIPNGFNKTLGELDSNIKKEFSHRSKALKLAEPIIEMLRRKFEN